MCTGISLKTVEQTIFWGRTQEFDLDLPYQGVIIPKDYLIEDTLTAFETKYAVMGIGVKGMSTMIDGVNQAGIAGGSFILPITITIQVKKVSKIKEKSIAWPRSCPMGTIELCYFRRN